MNKKLMAYINEYDDEVKIDEDSIKSCQLFMETLSDEVMNHKKVKIESDDKGQINLYFCDWNIGDVSLKFLNLNDIIYDYIYGFNLGWCGKLSNIDDKGKKILNDMKILFEKMIVAYDLTS